MNDNKYTAGSVAQLLGTEVPTSGKVTKLQALFSKPAAQSPALKVQSFPAGFICNPRTNSVDDHSIKKTKYVEQPSEASRQEDMTKNSRTKLRQMQSSAVSDENSATEQVTEHSAAVCDDVSHLSRKAVNAKNALMRIEAKETTKSVQSQRCSRDPAQDARTVFVGNVALNVNKKVLLRLFKSCGTIETVRLRSVPVADLKLPKKASVITKQFHPSRNSANAYIVFATEAAAKKALHLNGTELEGLHIRVNPASTKPKHDHEKSVFIGNLPFDVEEEPVRQHFGMCGAITNIRVVRDKTTGAGKGFGYVSFSDRSSVTLALSLDKQPLNGRQLRVQRSTEKTKPVQQKMTKKHNLPSVKRDDRQKSAKISRSVRSKDESNNAAHKPPKMKMKKGQQQSPLTDSNTKTTSTLMNHKKVKEHKKKKLKKRTETRRKQSLGQLLMKKSS